MDLDNVGSPITIAARIHALAPDMPVAVPIEALCRQFDIFDIKEIETAGFEAALITDANRSAGSILLAAGRHRQRSRYSLAHELGHFLLEYHKPVGGAGFECSLADLHLLDAKDRDRRRRVEAEANRFAAALLMPVRHIRAGMRSPAPDLADIVRLADEFDMSKEATARAYVAAQREPVAVLVLQHNRIERLYRSDDMPWIVPRRDQPLPVASIAYGHRLQPRNVSAIEECDAETWFDERGANRVEILTEQLLAQRDGYAMLLLHARLVDEDED